MGVPRVRRSRDGRLIPELGKIPASARYPSAKGGVVGITVPAAPDLAGTALGSTRSAPHRRPTPGLHQQREPSRTSSRPHQRLADTDGANHDRCQTKQTHITPPAVDRRQHSLWAKGLGVRRRPCAPMATAPGRPDRAPTGLRTCRPVQSRSATGSFGNSRDCGWEGDADSPAAASQRRRERRCCPVIDGSAAPGTRAGAGLSLRVSGGLPPG